MFEFNGKVLDPMKYIEGLEKDNAELCNKVDALLCDVKALKEETTKLIEKCSYWEMRCDEKDRELQICEAQMEVVRLIFGKGGC